MTSDMKITMITGDSELTACSVSRQLNLTPLPDHLLLEGMVLLETIILTAHLEIFSY